MSKNNKCAQVVLGINSAYHESASAIIVDGHVVAAVEEERFSGYKHGKPLRVDNAHHLPIESIEYCLKEAKLGWHDLDAIAYSLDPKLRQQQACIGSDGRHDDFGHQLGENMFQRSLARLPRMLRNHTNARLHFVPHHISHAWYAIGTSPFESAALLVMDGIGEGASVSLGNGDRKQLHLERQSLFPHSIGLAWEKVACFLGFSKYDACKVMALAGMNTISPSNKITNHLYWCEDGLMVDQKIFNLEHPEDFSGLEHWFGCKREEAAHNNKIRRDIASVLQQATEEILLLIAEDLQKHTGEKELAYAGGVALNCRANSELAARGPFSQIHIGPAAHDAGTAAGAAWHVYTTLTGMPVPHQSSAGLIGSGPHPITRDINGSRAGWNHQSKVTMTSVARLLKAGEVIGWLDGRCEFGPRALGRRSLLASPIRKDIVTHVNRIKRRFSFEPLALAVPIERAKELFDIPKVGFELTAFMLMTVRPNPLWHDRLEHLLHADGTIRLQTVKQEDHPRFHALLLESERLTNLPLLVNTSFNPRGKPMPATINQALPLAEELGIDHMFVDGECWRKVDNATKIIPLAPSSTRLAQLSFVR